MLNRLWITLLTATLAGDPNMELTASICTNDAGDGKVISSSAGEVDPEHDYISFAGIAGADAGDVVYTITVYDTAVEEATDNYILIVDYVDGYITVR